MTRGAGSRAFWGQPYFQYGVARRALATFTQHPGVRRVTSSRSCPFKESCPNILGGGLRDPLRKIASIFPVHHLRILLRHGLLQLVWLEIRYAQPHRLDGDTAPK